MSNWYGTSALPAGSGQVGLELSQVWSWNVSADALPAAMHASTAKRTANWIKRFKDETPFSPTTRSVSPHGGSKVAGNGSAASGPHKSLTFRHRFLILAAAPDG